MKTKGIVKNLYKFNNIKTPKGLSLKPFLTTERLIFKQGDTGSSTITFGDKWFMLPKGRALFKTYDAGFRQAVNKARVFNEMLICELCKQIGLSCAEYEPASLENKTGIITYDMAGNKELVSMLEFLDKAHVRIRELNLLGAASAIANLQKRGYTINKKEILSNLYKMIILGVDK